MFLVWIDIKHMFVWSTVFIPLLLTVAVNTTVVTVMSIQSKIQWWSIWFRLWQGSGNSTTNRNHWLAFWDRLCFRSFIRLLACKQQLIQGFCWKEKDRLVNIYILSSKFEHAWCVQLNILHYFFLSRLLLFPLVFRSGSASDWFAL